MALLFHLSSRSDLTTVPTGWDKPIHAGAYAVLGLLALRACHGGLRRLAARPTLAALLLTAGYAVLDEARQGQIPGRHASPLDWAADLVGAVGAVGIVGLIVWVQSRRPPRRAAQRADRS
jgi:VanZ family protein